MAFPTDWGRKCAVTVPAAKISGTSHSNFPVLITEDMLPSEMFDADGSYPALNGGGDVRFSSDSAGATQLPCSIRKFVTDNNPANGSAIIWVKVPTLATNSGSGTTVYVWYNKAGESQPAAGDSYGSQAVWSDYELVMHLDDTSYTDETGNGHNGTFGGTSGGIVSTGHPWGGSWLDFNTGGYISTIANDETITQADELTMQAIINADDAQAYRPVVGSWDDDKSFIQLMSDGKLFSADSSLLADAITPALSGGTTRFLTGNFSKANSWLRLYVAGSLHTSEPTAGNGLGNPEDGRFDIGGYYLGTATYRMDGRIGEVRLRHSTLSADWISTEYANQSDPATFASAGTPEDAAGGGGVSAELTGNSSTAAVGTLGVATEGSVSVTPSGVSATSAVGTLGATAEINASAELTGVFSSGAVGTITAEVGGGATANLSGNESVASVGALGVSTDVNAFIDLLGNSSTGAVGTLIVVTGLQVALSGNAATGAVGTLGVTAEVNASAALTGVGSSGAVGTLEVTVPITASVELTGVGATGAIGTLTAVGAGQVWTEISPVSTIWTEIS